MRSHFVVLVVLWLSGCTQNFISIESIESKTRDGKPVYNQIKLVSQSDKDIWLMKQSHFGFKTHDWEELKIVVNKTKNPYQASYFQMEGDKEIEYRVSCFVCHANGPRAIRANYNSPRLKYSLKDKLTLWWWNLKIKSYGKIETPENDYLNSKKRRVPLKYKFQNLAKDLEIKACIKCHGSSHPFGRKKLQKHHVITARHLVITNQMPPWPYTLSEEEKREVLSHLKFN